jgi:NADH dehydrogenase
LKVLVTGGTGYVGQEIVRRLRETGHPVRILARNPDSEEARRLVSQYQVEVHAGDVMDADSVAGSLNGIHAVIHLVGIISEVGTNTFENIHVRGTENVVCAAQQAGVKRFVHMSALGTRPNAVSRYHQTKWVAEEFVRRRGLDFTIFRPSLIFGPRDQFVNLFAKMSRFSPVLPVMGKGTAHFQPVSVQVVAEAFVRALEEPRTIGQTFDLSGPDTLTFPEILDDILSVSKRKRLKVRIPTPLARLQAAVLEFVFPLLLRKAPPLNCDQLVMLEEGNIGNAKPANDILKLQQIGFRDGISYLRSAKPRSRTP